jgi:hypothetical protein
MPILLPERPLRLIQALRLQEEDLTVVQKVATTCLMRLSVTVPLLMFRPSGEPIEFWQTVRRYTPLPHRLHNSQL